MTYSMNNANFGYIDFEDDAEHVVFFEMLKKTNCSGPFVAPCVEML